MEITIIGICRNISGQPVSFMFSLNQPVGSQVQPQPAGELDVQHQPANQAYV